MYLSHSEGQIIRATLHLKKVGHRDSLSKRCVPTRMRIMVNVHMSGVRCHVNIMVQ